MNKELNNLAIIPARGGSKRIPRKNIRNFLGKPIILYSIEAALKSELFDEVMVSTDDYEISETARRYGANVPFMRSAKNSDDISSTTDVLIEVLNQYQNNFNKHFDFGCCIYPTAPFVNADILIRAFNKLIESGAKSILPVVKFSYPILRSFSMENEFLRLNWPEYLNSRSQDLPPAYHDAGQFYFFHIEYFLIYKKLYMDNTIGIVISESVVQDIDTESDWRLAELKYKELQLI